MGGKCKGASCGLTVLSLRTEVWGRGGGVGAGGGGGGGGGGAEGGAEGRAFPLVCEPGGDTNGALMGEVGGRGGGGGGGGGGRVGGGGAGTLGRAGAVLASEAVPSLGDAGTVSCPLIALVGSRGEGAREPGACPVLPPAASL